MGPATRPRGIRLAIAAALGVALGAGEAAAEDDYARSGFYAGVTGVYAIETFDVNGLNFDNGGGFNVRAGYRVLERLGLDVQFEYVDGFEAQGIEIDSWSFMGNARGYLLTDRIQPYMLFGMGYVKDEASGFGSSASEDDFAVQVGSGIDAYITRNVVLYFETVWLQPADDLEDFSYATVGGGIQYRF